MRRIIVLLIVSIQTAYSGFELRSNDARSAALGGAMTGMTENGWSLFVNPAGMGHFDGSEVDFSFSPQLFGIAGLSDIGFAAVSKTAIGSIGIRVQRFGNTLYRELTTTIGYARALDGFGVGIALHRYSVTIERYGSASTLGVDLGIQVRFLHSVRWGISLHNVNAPTIGAAKEKLPQQFQAGVVYLPDQNLRFTFDAQKQTAAEFSLRCGVEYALSVITLRAGFSEEPSEISGGFGIQLSSLQFDYGMTYHSVLGWTHRGSISFRISGGSHE